MDSAIRFITKNNRYRKPVGHIDTVMGFGVHSALVQRGIAEFVEMPTSPLVAAGVSQPVAVTTEAPKRTRTRRIDSIEEND